MCGICGYVGDHRPELLEPMNTAMVHRGPDDSGRWHDAPDQVGLGHRRLSIIDLSAAGHQPMCTEDGRYWITYNGEIYNFQEHRERYVAAGVKFRGHSDTEVILQLYAEMGPRCVEALNGIFAFAIWDARERTLFLARDHAGIKPIYYWQDGRKLFFASEIKALLKIPEIPRRLNRKAIGAYLTFLWVPGEETMLERIRKIEPGHYMLWRDGRIETRQWFTLDYEPDESRSEAYWVDAVRDTFLRTTRRQMVADVPLGAFLSGGLDSSSIAACMRHAFPEREIDCYTVRIDKTDMHREQFVDDYPHAARVAGHLGINLHEVELRSDVISLLPKMVYHLDEPDADPAVFPSYMISKLARERGTTVLLSGTGGDEVFFGYRSHRALRQLERLRLMPRWLLSPALAGAAALGAALFGAQAAMPRRVDKFRRFWDAQGFDRYLALSDWSDGEVRSGIFSRQLASEMNGHDESTERVARYFREFRGRGELNRRSHVLIQTFLAAHNFLYTDKSSMAVSIEARVPFMDIELMRLCASVPERWKLRGGETKYILKKTMEPLLPRDVIYRTKMGFGAPLRKWLAEDLRELLAEVFAPERVWSRGLFDPDAVRRILADNEANRADHAYLIYALLTLETWIMTFVDRPGEELAWPLSQPAYA